MNVKIKMTFTTWYTSYTHKRHSYRFSIHVIGCIIMNRSNKLHQRPLYITYIYTSTGLSLTYYYIQQAAVSHLKKITFPPPQNSLSCVMRTEVYFAGFYEYASATIGDFNAQPCNLFIGSTPPNLHFSSHCLSNLSLELGPLIRIENGGVCPSVPWSQTVKSGRLIIKPHFDAPSPKSA